LPPAEVAEAVAEEVREATRGWRDFLPTKFKEIKIPQVSKLLGKRKIFGSPAIDFLAGMGTGAAVRMATRWGLGWVTGGSGYLIAAASGAAAGGAVEGLRSYQREKARLKEKSYTDVDFDHFLLEARGKRWHDKLERYFELDERIDLSGEKIRLRQVIENKLRTSEARGVIFKKEFWRGVGKGAAIGAIGGLAGAYIGDLVGQYLFGTEEMKQATKEAAKAGDEARRQALELAKEKAADAYSKTYEAVTFSGLKGLEEKTFTAMAGKGEGLTHMARKLIGDYLVQQQALGGDGFSDVFLGKAELVYAEDLMRKTLLGGDRVVQLGENFKLKGAQIWDIIKSARGISEGQIENLNKEWVWQIKDKTWAEMLDYSKPYNADNNFSKEIINRAIRESDVAARKAGIEAGKSAAESAIPSRRPSPQTIRAKDGWLSRKMLINYGFAAALAAEVTAIGVLGHRLIKRSRKERSQKNKDLGTSIPPDSEPAAPSRATRFGRVVGKGAARVRELTRGNTEDLSDEDILKESQGGLSKRAEQFGRLAKAGKEGPRSLIAGTLHRVWEKAPARSEVRKRIAKMINRVEVRREKSEGTPDSAEEKPERPPAGISLISALGRAAQRMSEREKGERQGARQPEAEGAQEVAGGEEEPRGLEAAEGGRQETSAIEVKEGGGGRIEVPGIEEDVQGKLESLLQEIRQKINPKKIHLIRPSMMESVEAYEGCHKLNEALDRLPLEEFAGVDLVFNSNPEIYDTGTDVRVRLNPAWSAEYMEGYLRSNLPEIQRRHNLQRENNIVKERVKGELQSISIDILNTSADSDHEGFIKLEQLVDHLRQSGLKEVNLRMVDTDGDVYKSSMGENIFIRIDHRLSVPEMKEFLTQAAEEVKRLRG